MYVGLFVFLFLFCFVFLLVFLVFCCFGVFLLVFWGVILISATDSVVVLLLLMYTEQKN